MFTVSNHRGEILNQACGAALGGGRALENDDQARQSVEEQPPLKPLRLDL